MYNDTVTLFCKYHSTSGDVWYPFVLHGVNLNMDKASIMKLHGPNSEDKAILNIAIKQDGPVLKIGEREWLPPKAWKRQTDEKLQKTITFVSGEDASFFWKGEWLDENPISDDDTQWGRNGFYHYMNSTYDYVFSVTWVGGPFHIIPHFEITAK